MTTKGLNSGDVDQPIGVSRHVATSSGYETVSKLWLRAPSTASAGQGVSFGEIFDAVSSDLRLLIAPTNSHRLSSMMISATVLMAPISQEPQYVPMASFIARMPNIRPSVYILEC
nr:hypothetical protein Iba_chr09cCG13910 [Ipomoea batatas]GMD36374.1 hypothetical protein Iba_chr09dCG15800 [Ipomoea batatas]